MGGTIKLVSRTFSHVSVLGIASMLPKNRLTVAGLSDLYGEKMVKRIAKATGIEELRVAPLGTTASDYCAEAAKRLFEAGGFRFADVDGLVFVSQSPDYAVPHTSAILQHRLGLPSAAIAMDLNFGCAGYLYALFQGAMLITTGYCKNVLLCVGDTMSRHVHPQDRALRMVMGDGGTATLLSHKEGTAPVSFSFFTDGGGAESLIIPAGGARTPCSAGATDVMQEDEDGNARTAENLYMDGTAIMNFALSVVPRMIDAVLRQAGWEREDVGLYALHQANSFMVKYIAKKMKLQPAKVPVDVVHTGNTSSPSIPLMLCNRYAGQNEMLEKVVACGFGTGLSCAAGTLDLSRTLICPTGEI